MGKDFFFFGDRKFQIGFVFYIYLSPEEHDEESKISLTGSQRLNVLNAKGIALIWKAGVYLY